MQHRHQTELTDAIRDTITEYVAGYLDEAISVETIANACSDAAADFGPQDTQRDSDIRGMRG
jgi:hypothetical protein